MTVMKTQLSSKLVRFNPENAEHRKVFREFLDTGKWQTDFRFELEFPHADVPSMIYERTLRFYMNNDTNLSIKEKE